MTALGSQALQLSAGERLKLIEEVWDSLVAEAAALPVSPEEMDELQRRKVRYTHDPSSLVDWQDLKRTQVPTDVASTHWNG